MPPNPRSVLHTALLAVLIGAIILKAVLGGASPNIQPSEDGLDQVRADKIGDGSFYTLLVLSGIFGVVVMCAILGG